MLRVLVCTIVAVAYSAAQQAQQAPQRVDGTPLLRAKLALEMTRARVLEQRWTDASASLRDASKALADFARDFPGPHAETALFIRQEIDAYAPRIGKSHDDALDRIDLWRQPVEEWYGALHKSTRQ